MKAILDHVGVAVTDLGAALAFYRDVFGLDVEAPEEVASQRVRAHFIALGAAKLEVLEATSAASAIAKFTARRGPGLHHIALRVDDIHAALTHLKARGVRLIDEQPRPGAEQSLVAFIHPSSAHGVLVELKQAGLLRHVEIGPDHSVGGTSPAACRFRIGDLELISFPTACSASMAAACSEPCRRRYGRNMRPPTPAIRLRSRCDRSLVRGARTMLIDAGLGSKESRGFSDDVRRRSRRSLEIAMAEAGVRPEQVDLVLASHLHFDHAGGFTYRDAGGRLRPAFPRAQYIVRRGEWEEANRASASKRTPYFADNYVPLAEAGVLQLVDEDATIMPGVKVRRTGGHTLHHQIVLIDSKGSTAAYAADLMPTAAHVRDGWSTAFDLYPVECAARSGSLRRKRLKRERSSSSRTIRRPPDTPDRGERSVFSSE